MPERFKPLTEAELETIRAARAAAREKFKRYRDDDGAPSGVIDPDNPPLTDEQLARMRPAHEVHPELVAARLRRKAGQPRLDEPEKPGSLHLDADVIGRLRESGAGWQIRANDLLRKALGLKG